MRIISQPNSLLLKKFFRQSAVTKKIKLEFPIPADKEHLADFYEAHGEQYREGVKDLLNRLSVIAKEAGVLDNEGKEALEIFFEKFDFNKTSSNYYIGTIFPLYSLGVTYLAEIVDVVERDKNWSESQKIIIKNFLHDLATPCSPGVHTHICATKFALSSDLETELMDIRRKLAEQIALEVLKRNDVEMSGALENGVGIEVHYVTAFLNAYRKKLALPAVADVYSDDYYMPTPAMQKEFYDLMVERLDASQVIDAIMLKHQAILASLQPDETLSALLMKYGMDDKPLIYQIATLNDDSTYQLKAHVEYYVMHTLFIRMVNSDLLDQSKMIPYVLESVPDAMVYVPTEANIRLAYIAYSDKSRSDEPLVLHCLESFWGDAKNTTVNMDDALALCTEAQRNELSFELRKLIALDWPARTSSLSVKDQVNVLVHFNKKFPLASLQLLRMLNESTLSSDLRQQLAIEQNMLARVRSSNDSYQLVSYLALYGKEHWLSILLDQLQGMDLLNHKPVITIVEALSTLDVSKEEISKVLVSESICEACETLITANIPLNEEIVRFLMAHTANAKDLAITMFLFHQFVGAKIDTDFLIFIAANEVNIPPFLSCMTNDEHAIQWLTKLIEWEVLNAKQVKKLLDHAHYTRDMMSLLSDLYVYNESFCKDHIDSILGQARNASQIGFTRQIIHYCKSNDLKLTKTKFDNIFQNNFQADMDDTQLAFCAAMLGMTELLENMIALNTVTINQFSSSGANLLVVALLNDQVETCNMLLYKGADLDEPITIKVSLLQNVLSDTKPAELAAFLSEKSAGGQLDDNAEIVVIGRELVDLVGSKELSAMVSAVITNTDLSHHRRFSTFQPPTIKLDTEKDPKSLTVSPGNDQ